MTETDKKEKEIEINKIETDKTGYNYVLNIPNASKIHEIQHKHVMEQENQIIEKQQKLIEKAFAEFKGETQQITVELTESLNKQLRKQLQDKGYNVYQQYYSDDNNSSNNKWIVEIEVAYINNNDVCFTHHRISPYIVSSRGLVNPFNILENVLFL